MIYVFKRMANDTVQYGFALEQSSAWLAYQKITEEEHTRLFKGQSEGKIIKFKNDATPYLADPEPQKQKKNSTMQGLSARKNITHTLTVSEKPPTGWKPIRSVCRHCAETSIKPNGLRK